MKMEDIICFISGVFLSLVTALFGDWTVNVQVLLIFMGFNIISGLIRAYHQKSNNSASGGISSRALLEGLTKNMLPLILVSVAHWCDILLEINYVMNMAGYAFIGHYLLSIIENYTVVAGNPPKIFEKVLDIIGDMEEDMKEDGKDD